MASAASSFSGSRRGGDDPAAQCMGHVDGGQAHAAAGPENQHPLAGAMRGAAGQGEQDRAVALDERGRLAEVDRLGHRHQREGGHHYLLGESAEADEGDDPVATADPRDAGAHRGNLAGDLAAGDERGGGFDLVAPLADAARRRS